MCSEGRREDPHIRSCTPGSLMKRRQRGCQLCFKGDQSVRRRFLFFSFWPQPQHAEVPQPGIKPARQQQPSHSRDCRIPNPHTTRTLMALPFHPVPFLWCHCPIITTSRDFAANSAAQVFRTFLAISQNRNSISQNRNTLHCSVDKKVSQNHLPLPHMRDTEGFFFFWSFCYFLAAPAAYGGSQARGRIGAVDTGLRQSHSNAGSEPSLQPTPQLVATPDR